MKKLNVVDCKGCPDTCCSTYNINIDVADLFIVPKKLGLTVDDFLETFVDPSGFLKKKDIKVGNLIYRYCAFIDETKIGTGQACMIHDFKFEVCAKFKDCEKENNCEKNKCID